MPLFRFADTVLGRYAKKCGATRLIDNVRISVKTIFMTNVKWPRRVVVSDSQARQENYKHARIFV